MEFALVELERGRVVFEGSPSRKIYNPIGSVHGGYAATLLDSAGRCAMHFSLPAGQGYTTLELKIADHPALTEASRPVRAEGKIVSMGRRVGFSEARCAGATLRLSDIDPANLPALATGKLISRKPLAPLNWSDDRRTHLRIFSLAFAPPDYGYSLIAARAAN